MDDFYGFWNFLQGCKMYPTVVERKKQACRKVPGGVENRDSVAAGFLPAWKGLYPSAWECKQEGNGK